jgi:pilus assembly protein CpaE
MKNFHLCIAVRPQGPCSKLLDEVQRDYKSGSVDSHDPEDWQSLIAQLSQLQPDVLLLELEPIVDRLEQALEEVRSCCSRIKVVLVSPNLDSQQILRSIRAGADEFVHPPWEQGLSVALQRLAAAVDQRGGRQIGKVIAFLSAKGGCGATTLACHVASNLHRRTGKSVLLADLDLTSGMVDFLMKTHTTYSILDATQNLPRLDASLWKALTVEAKPGLSVIPAPISFAYQQSPEHDDLCATIRFMRTQHDWVVLDLGRSLNSVASTVYNEVDQVFLVSVLEVIALHGLRNIVRRLTEWGQDLDKLQLILNRAPKNMDITKGELENILGRSLYAVVPNDYHSLNQAYSQGTLISESNILKERFSLLADKIAGVQPVKKKKKFAVFG